MTDVQQPADQISGGKVQSFRAGWAVPMGVFGKAHYFKRTDVGIAKALCGRLEGWAGRLFEQGSYERCAHCKRIVQWRRKQGLEL